MASPTMPKKAKEGKKEAEADFPHSFEEIIEEWRTQKPDPDVVTYKSGKYLLGYRVVLGGWSYTIQAHVHEFLTNLGPGSAWVCGIDGGATDTPRFVVAQASQFALSDAAAVDKFYAGKAPTKI